MADTVREIALQAMMDALEAMKEGKPVADPYTVEFSEIERADVGKLAKGRRFAVAILDGEETKNEDTFPTVRCTMRVLIEFYVYVDTGEEPSKMLNVVLGEIERKIREDKTLGGKVVDVEIVGNELEIDGPFDDQCVGTIFTLVKYRHHTNDPRIAI